MAHSALGQGETDGKHCCALAKSSWLKATAHSRNTDGSRRLIAKSDSQTPQVLHPRLGGKWEFDLFIYKAVKKLC